MTATMQRPGGLVRGSAFFRRLKTNSNSLPCICNNSSDIPLVPAAQCLPEFLLFAYPNRYADWTSSTRTELALRSLPPFSRDMLEDDAAPDQSQAQAVGKKQKRFQCERCQRMFARLEHLQRHERTRKAPPYQWLRWRTEDLNLGFLLDTQEKPFSCQKCDHRFTRR